MCTATSISTARPCGATSSIDAVEPGAVQIVEELPLFELASAPNRGAAMNDRRTQIGLMATAATDRRSEVTDEVGVAREADQDVQETIAAARGFAARSLAILGYYGAVGVILPLVLLAFPRPATLSSGGGWSSEAR